MGGVDAEALEHGMTQLENERKKLRDALEAILLEYCLTGEADSCQKCGPRDFHNPGCVFAAGWKAMVDTKTRLDES